VLAAKARLLAIRNGKQQCVVKQDETNNSDTGADVSLEDGPTGSHYAALGSREQRDVFDGSDGLVAVLEAALYTQDFAE
jgi:hypothetical protein